MFFVETLVKKVGLIYFQQAVVRVSWDKSSSRAQELVQQVAKNSLVLLSVFLASKAFCFVFHERRMSSFCPLCVEFWAALELTP